MRGDDEGRYDGGWYDEGWDDEGGPTVRVSGRRLLVAVPVLLALGLSAAQATPPGAFYYGESLLGRQKSGNAVCELWLDGNGRYSVFYGSGRPVTVDGPGGRLGNEGRQGVYDAEAVDGGVRICLRPDEDTPARGAGAGMALFRKQGCVTVPTHPIGEVFELDFAGETYTMSVAEGR